LVECADTALAFREIKEKNLTTIWAIWWDLAAELYWLNILCEWIETNKKNYTRFFIVQKDTWKQNDDFDKASLHLVLPHQVWSLVQILSIISAYWINLTKIESLPILGEPFHYRFYLDVKFSDKNRYKQMLNAINPLLKELDVLWEYIDGEPLLEN
jgi:prephenate dehydratase